MIRGKPLKRKTGRLQRRLPANVVLQSLFSVPAVPCRRRRARSISLTLLQLLMNPRTVVNWNLTMGLSEATLWKKERYTTFRSISECRCAYPLPAGSLWKVESHMVSFILRRVTCTTLACLYICNAMFSADSAPACMSQGAAVFRIALPEEERNIPGSPPLPCLPEPSIAFSRA